MSTFEEKSNTKICNFLVDDSNAFYISAQHNKQQSRGVFGEPFLLQSHSLHSDLSEHVREIIAAPS